MRIVNLVQQSPEWHAHRAAHWNASDAPAMLGASSNTKRTELLRAISTGVEREFSDYVQEKIIGPGHTFEALAREVAESIIGEDLYPCVVVDGKLSASLDGLTVGGDTAWEHKRLNKALRDAMRDGCYGFDLPEMYRIQCEHQLIVSKAEQVLFMASEWDDEGNLIEERHCWYYPDTELRARIVAGWEQFAADLRDYQPREHAPEPAGRAPGTLPTLRIEVTGMVTASNLAEWEAAATALFSGINRDLSTDQDFADAEMAVKGCSDIESQLEAAKARILSGTESIEATFKTIDRMKEQARSTRLALAKLVDARKLARRTEIVERGRQAVIAHYDSINAGIGAYALPYPLGVTTELGAAIKGKKSFASMEDAIDSAVANLKIAASQQADRVRASMAALDDAQGEYATLFPDRVQLCASKAPDDLRNLAAARIAEHKAKEQKRLDDERERIRHEEARKLAEAAIRGAVAKSAADAEREQSVAAPGTGVCDTAETDGPGQAGSAWLDPARGKNFATGPDGGGYMMAGDVKAHPCVDPVSAKGPESTATIKLGDINARIAPLSISADGMSKLGFDPVNAQGAAKLYRIADLPWIIDAMVAKLRAASCE